MGVSEFDNFIKQTRKEFRDALDRASIEVEEIAIGASRECCSEFEERTLIENLKEELNDFSKGLAAV